jgi:hypothetical protein
VIGYNAEDDRRNGHHVTESGIVVVSGEQRPAQTIQTARSSV